MYTKFLLPLLMFPLLAFSQNGKGAVSSYSGVAVIELFTSQGDINSPPADKLLSEIIADADKNNKPVYCLSMHVDFWNRYGWKDPFSSFKYTTRLTNYTSVLGLKETYTPFMLLNGRTVLPSPDKNKVTAIIAGELSKKAQIDPEFSYQIYDDTLDISYDVNTDAIAGKAGSNNYINIVIVEKGLSTKVSKGDNAGVTLKNDNVTRLLFTSDLKLKKGLLRVPLKKLKPGVNKTIILFIQEKTTKRVLGATARSFEK